MRLGFLHRKKGDQHEGAPSSEPGRSQGEATGPSVPFDGLTEEWRLAGRMHVEGRLSDALNKREPIEISDVSWAPIDGSRGLEPAPGLRSIDPYDLIAVLAGPETIAYSEPERLAHRVRKVPYEVGLEVPPYRVIGT
ncbi:MAG: hypothetical protein FJ038_13110, partial [Chloroflexi bacterium]|nr:hypothetical protein [Chloroflexota bacterium]